MSLPSSSSSITLSSLLFKNTNTFNNLNIQNIINTNTNNHYTTTNTISSSKKYKKMDKKIYHVASCNILSDNSVADIIPCDVTTIQTTTTTMTTTTTSTPAVKSKSCESESMIKIVKIDKDKRNNKRKFSESFKKDIKNLVSGVGVIPTATLLTKTNTLTDKDNKELFNKKDLIEYKREEQIIEVEQENNENSTTKKIKINTEKDEMFEIFQPWALRTYGDQAKTKTITLKKKQRILKALDGKEQNNPDSSKFRFWVKSKGFTTKKPVTFIDTEINNLMMTKDNRHLILDKDNIDLYVASTSKDFGERFYRKVAVVEEFFNIIFDVHVNLGGRSGRHAGQKRTYRIITETYAFLPREAVTKFLSGCPECKKNLRPFSPNRIDDQLTESSSEFDNINLSLPIDSSSKQLNLSVTKQLETFKKSMKLENHSRLLKIDNRRFSEPSIPPKISNIEIESKVPSYLDDLAIKLSEFNTKNIELNSENYKIYNNLVNYYQYLSKFYNQQPTTTVNWMSTSPLNLTSCYGVSTKNILELRNFLNPIKTIQDYQILKEFPTTSSYHSNNVIPISPNLNTQMSLITEGKLFEKNSVINFSSDLNDLKIPSPKQHHNHHHYYQQPATTTTTKYNIPSTSDNISINISDNSMKKYPSYISDTMTTPITNFQTCNIYKPESIEISPEIVVVNGSSSSSSSSCCSSESNDNDIDDVDDCRQTCAINLSKKFHETTKIISKCDVNTDVIDLKINKKNADDDVNDADRKYNKQVVEETMNMETDSRRTDNEDDNKVDFKPITSTYLKLTRSMGLSDEDALKIDDLIFVIKAIYILLIAF